MAKRRVNSRIQELRMKACVRCGYGPEHHELGNYADGPMIGRQFLVCPSATYKPRGDVLKEDLGFLGTGVKREVVAQRDALLAALEQINALPSELAGEAWAIARQAIAKVTVP